MLLGGCGPGEGGVGVRFHSEVGLGCVDWAVVSMKEVAFGVGGKR